MLKTGGRMRTRRACALLVGLVLQASLALASAPESSVLLCEAVSSARLTTYADDAGAVLSSVSVASRGPFTTESQTIVWPDESSVQLRTVHSAGALVQLQVEVRRGEHPDWFAVHAGDCRLLSRRELIVDASGRWQALRILTEEQEQIRPYNPPAPIIRYPTRPQGPIVGHIDSGIDYRRIDFQAHFLADSLGNWRARDAWDGDQQPFDLDLGRSPLFPREHGSRVLDVLLQKNRKLSVIPLRYPRPQIETLGSHVRWLIDSGARLIMLPMGSTRASDWDSLQPVIEAHPNVAFVLSAGNDGSDLANRPVYPAIFPSANILTVTSVLADGHIAPGSNFGVAVDLGVPAEGLSVRGIDGLPATVSGSSFAVPIATAWLAGLQTASPELQGEALINALLMRRNPSPDGLTGGWIAQMD